MSNLSWLDGVPFWFTVLGDHEAARPAAAVLRAFATREVPQTSGRPWLLGRWPEGTVATGQAGTRKLAVIGQHRITAEQLAGAAGRAQTVADLDRLATSLPGSFHLLASLDGRARVQGTVTGVRRVFHARVGGRPSPPTGPTCWPACWARGSTSGGWRCTC